METRVIILLSIVIIVFIINRLYFRADEKRKLDLNDNKILSDNDIMSMFKETIRFSSHKDRFRSMYFKFFNFFILLMFEFRRNKTRFVLKIYPSTKH